jgi:hypothetical protein
VKDCFSSCSSAKSYAKKIIYKYIYLFSTDFSIPGYVAPKDKMVGGIINRKSYGWNRSSRLGIFMDRLNEPTEVSQDCRSPGGDVNQGHAVYGA